MPDGSRVQRSFRELVTQPSAPYALDYPQAFYNAAAFGLLSLLAQWAFEPADSHGLAEYLATPLSDEAFDSAVAPLRSSFALDGDGPRFMQGPAPDDPKKAVPVEEAVLITHRGDKRFLHRADPDWAVPVDQAALLLFARNTFYEGTGGRGYQKGTNGDTPVRTFVTLPWDGASDALDLRRSLWLNVLHRERQVRFAGDYAAPGAGYDAPFWTDPPTADVPTGGTSLRAGLAWMSATHWLWYDALEGPATCAVTGRPLAPGTRAARTLTKRSTGIGYGTKGDLEAGSRADRLFRHPNVPLEVVLDKKTGDRVGRRPFLVHRTRGLTDALGASFFGDPAGRLGARYELAPAVAELATQGSAVAELDFPVRLWSFGFHMLSSHKNVHGATEQDTVRYRPLIGETQDDTLDLHAAASEAIADAAATARRAAYDLGTALQRAAGLGVRATEDPASGRIQVAPAFATTASVDDPFGADTLAPFWRDVRHALSQHALDVAAAAHPSEDTDAPADPDALTAALPALQSRWEDDLAKIVWRHYGPAHDRHIVHPRTMPYAAAAHRMLAGALRKHRLTEPADAS